MEIEKIIRYLRSDFKNVTIAILFVAVYFLDKRNTALNEQCLSLLQKQSEKDDKQRIEDRLDKNDYRELARSYKDLFFTVQQIKHEKGIDSFPSVPDHNASNVNAERMQ